MMMELFNDYGTFTYKILQTKNKKFNQKNKTKIWAHNLQNFNAGKTTYPTQAFYWPSCRQNIDKSPKYGWP